MKFINIVLSFGILVVIAVFAVLFTDTVQRTDSSGSLSAPGVRGMVTENIRLCQIGGDCVLTLKEEGEDHAHRIRYGRGNAQCKAQGIEYAYTAEPGAWLEIRGAVFSDSEIDICSDKDGIITPAE